MTSVYLAPVLLLALATGTTTQADCLRYDERVSLTGTVVARTFPGPPNFESVAKGDRAETVPVLMLSGPVCVSADPNAPEDNPALARVSSMQILSSFRELGMRPGRTVTLSGALFARNTGHHHTPVLLSDVRIGPRHEPRKQ